MKNAEIDAMPAGMELNELIATKVMGWKGAIEETYWPNKEWVWRDARGYKIYGSVLFSTEISAAWLVVEKIRDAKIYLSRGNPSEGAETFHCTFDGCSNNGSAHAETAPLAICRAALKLLTR